MTQVLDGKKVAATIREEIAAKVSDLVSAGGRPPGLAAVLVGENPASQVYVRSKARASEKAGIVSRVINLPATTSQNELMKTVDELNRDDSIDGILVQLPLPDGLIESEVLAAIDPAKDVDGFHPSSVGKLWLDQPSFCPATPAGILELLKRSEIPLKGKSAVIVGRSAIVGKPMAALLLREHCTVTVCHSRTQDLPGVCREADILVAAIGRPAMLDASYVGEGAVVIDVGINRVTEAAEVERLFPGDEKRKERFESKGSVLVGDVDYVQAFPIASAITPVPGGVGPLTIAMLLSNTLTAAKARQGITD